MAMELKTLFEKALALDPLNRDEALALYTRAELPALMAVAHAVRQKMHPHNKVGWIIDRNVNYANGCVSGCQFCNFFRAYQHPEAYVYEAQDLFGKIELMLGRGGRQLLMQGGCHPRLGIDYYERLFSGIKARYPEVRLHALGPPEVAHIAHLEKLSSEKTLERLVKAGLDSLPGAGAEILSDRVRKTISPNKCTSAEWLDVMRVAHQMGLVTSATMMLGHIETVEERIEHLLAIRKVQEEKPVGHPGFLSFIPWPFQPEGTVMQRKYKIQQALSADEYIRFLALSRLVLNNIPHIQASWLTVGKETGQICLHAGADDFGSIMIEENVVSVAGASHQFDEQGIQQAIREAGFEPQQRNQRFEYLDGKNEKALCRAMMRGPLVVSAE